MNSIETCFGCGTTKLATTPPGTVFTTETSGQARTIAQLNRSNYPDLKVVQQGGQYHLVSEERKRVNGVF